MKPVIITQFGDDSVQCYSLLTPLNTGEATRTGSSWSWSWHVVLNGLNITNVVATRAAAVDAMLAQLQQ